VDAVIGWRRARFVFCVSGMALIAAASHASVSIDKVADQVAQPGALYTFQPRLLQSGSVLWRKSYGPDEMEVDPFTGAVRWTIPADYRQQSLHVGVIASDGVDEHESVWVLTVGDGRVRYLDADGNLSKALRKMRSGDTLVIRNGTMEVSGRSSRIDSKKRIEPPSGSAKAMTTVIAEDPGKLTMDVSDADAFGIQLIETEYIKIAGIVIKNAGRTGLRLFKTNNIYLKDIGISNSGRALNSYNHNIANLKITGSRDFLVEGLYSWGHSRYKVQFTNSERGVVRRSVARIDHYDGSYPIGGYQSYCSKNIVYQNNILVDSATSDFWVRFKNHQNAFGVPATGCTDLPVGNVFSGNIVLNSHIGAMQTDASDADGPTVWENMVAWDIALDRYKAGKDHVTPLLHGVGKSVTEHLTAGNVRVKKRTRDTYPRYFYSRSAPSIIRTSILSGFESPANLLWANVPTLTLEDSVLHQFDGTVTGGDESEDIRVHDLDPKLRYLPRAPQALARKCGGQQCGAVIMYLTGSAGTFWREPGYDALTQIPAWPVAAEHEMASHMRQYQHEGKTRSGDVGSLSGDRGFAKTSTNLTDYIWGYLGEPVPPLQAYARRNGDTFELSWLPVKSPMIKKYKVYSMVDGQPSFMGVVSHGERVQTFESDIRNVAGPLRVTSVTYEGIESEHGYDVLIRD